MGKNKKTVLIISGLLLVTVFALSGCMGTMRVVEKVISDKIEAADTAQAEPDSTPGQLWNLTNPGPVCQGYGGVAPTVAPDADCLCYGAVSKNDARADGTACQNGICTDDGSVCDGDCADGTTVCDGTCDGNTANCDGDCADGSAVCDGSCTDDGSACTGSCAGADTAVCPNGSCGQ